MRVAAVVALWVATSACGRVGFDATGGGDDQPPVVDVPFTCPTGYVAIPASEPFCVAKYEMKQVGGVATSIAEGVPWTMIDQSAAIASCQALGAGYDLISNAQWQALAHLIANQSSNWSSGVAYSGRLSAGHSDNAPSLQLAAGADDDPCAGTQNPCSPTAWNSQRRAMPIGTGDVVWDLGGNATEWTKDAYPSPAVPDIHVAELAQTDPRASLFGAPAVCSEALVPPYCAMGIVYSKDVGGTIVRGGGLDWGSQDGGVFTAIVWNFANDIDWNLGFRCVYAP